MSLRIYQRKRKFDQTPEPRGKSAKNKKTDNGKHLRFVVQMHKATRLHFDFRLEFGGVFKSWAVPKGPSLNPLDQRLAVFVEDHPLEYGSFEGVIPKGNYGAGTVMVWDHGTYVERGSESRRDSEIAMKKTFEKGHITFVLDGEKLKGEFALIRLKKGEDRAWLLVKKRDEHSTYKLGDVPNNLSVKTNRNIQEITDQAEADGDIWLPKQKKQKKKFSMEAKAKPTKLEKKEFSKPNQIKPKVSEKIKSDPMPRKNKPMIPTLSQALVQGDDWVFEKDITGLRAMAEVEGKRVGFYSKAGLPFAKKFPEIYEDLKQLGIQAVLDGEIIKTKKTAVYSVFDILYSDGKDLRNQALAERKKQLQKILSEGKHIQIAKPLSTLKSMERVVAKNLNSVYHCGTTSDWLVIPYPEKANLLSPKKNKAQKISETEKKSSASLKASPSAKTNQKTSPSLSLEEPRLTNLDKIFWPDEGYTKGDVLDYYKKVSPYILPFLKDRPQSLNRHPNGIAAPGFYQKDMTGHIPRWLKTERIFSESVEKSIDYVLCQDERSLLYIANLGCIEINPWFSRIGHLDKPDFLVIDLDPDGNSFDHVIDLAHEFHQMLESVGAKSFCKTSGATGIHIGVPVGARYDFDQVRSFAESLCRIVAKKFPATTSIERNPNRRRKKVYLDFMQNRRGQTLAAPYCLRPRAGAPVSMPLVWEDLKKGIKPEQFHLRNALRLIKNAPDLWRGVLGEAINLEKSQLLMRKKFNT